MKRSDLSVGMRVQFRLGMSKTSSVHSGFVRDLHARNQFMESGSPDRIRVESANTATSYYVRAQQIIRQDEAT